MLNLEQKIEFIREKVIMANNPECKTYEEALEAEKCLPGAEILYKSDYMSSTKHNQFKKYKVGNYDNHYYHCYSEMDVKVLHGVLHCVCWCFSSYYT